MEAIIRDLRTLFQTKASKMEEFHLLTYLFIHSIHQYGCYKTLKRPKRHCRANLCCQLTFTAWEMLKFKPVAQFLLGQMQNIEVKPRSIAKKSWYLRKLWTLKAIEWVIISYCKRINILKIVDIIGRTILDLPNNLGSCPGVCTR